MKKFNLNLFIYGGKKRKSIKYKMLLIWGKKKSYGKKKFLGLEKMRGYVIHALPITSFIFIAKNN